MHGYVSHIHEYINISYNYMTRYRILRKACRIFFSFCVRLLWSAGRAHICGRKWLCCSCRCITVWAALTSNTCSSTSAYGHLHCRWIWTFVSSYICTAGGLKICEDVRVFAGKIVCSRNYCTSRSSRSSSRLSSSKCLHDIHTPDTSLYWCILFHSGTHKSTNTCTQTWTCMRIDAYMHSPAYILAQHACIHESIHAPFISATFALYLCRWTQTCTCMRIDAYMHSPAYILTHACIHESIHAHFISATSPSHLRYICAGGGRHELACQSARAQSCCQAIWYGHCAAEEVST